MRKSRRRRRIPVMSTATRISPALGRWSGEAALYKIDPPLDFDGLLFDYVVVSGSSKPPGPPEVAVFPATAEGGVFLGEAICKVLNTTDHVAALSALLQQESS